MIRPSSKLTESLCSHCQTCALEISAVAASSIRSYSAAAPTPCSQDSIYNIPTLILSLSPASVIFPSLMDVSIKSFPLTVTSLRSTCFWWGLSPNSLLNCSIAIGTRNGCATHCLLYTSDAADDLLCVD